MDSIQVRSASGKTAEVHSDWLDIVCRNPNRLRGITGEIAAVDLMVRDISSELVPEHVADFVLGFNPDRMLDPTSDWPCNCVKGHATEPCLIAQFIAVADPVDHDDGLWLVDADALASWIGGMIEGHDSWDDTEHDDSPQLVNESALFHVQTNKKRGDLWRV